MGRGKGKIKFEIDEVNAPDSDACGNKVSPDMCKRNLKFIAKAISGKQAPSSNIIQKLRLEIKRGRIDTSAIITERNGRGQKVFSGDLYGFLLSKKWGALFLPELLEQLDSWSQCTLNDQSFPPYVILISSPQSLKDEETFTKLSLIYSNPEMDIHPKSLRMPGNSMTLTKWFDKSIDNHQEMLDQSKGKGETFKKNLENIDKVIIFFGEKGLDVRPFERREAIKTFADKNRSIHTDILSGKLNPNEFSTDHLNRLHSVGFLNETLKRLPSNDYKKAAIAGYDGMHKCFRSDIVMDITAMLATVQHNHPDSLISQWSAAPETLIAPPHQPTK